MAMPLSDAEQAALAACRTAKRRREIDVSRRLLRYGLREYLGVSGDGIRWGGQGPRHTASPGLWLSAAHGRRHAAAAWSGAGAIGVDIEHLGERPRWRRIMQAMFCDEDIDWINHGDAGDGLGRFLAVWTAREAYAKHTGGSVLGGLATPLLREAAAIGARDARRGDARVEVVVRDSWVAALSRPLRRPMPACLLAEPGSTKLAPWRADHAFVVGGGH